MKILVVRHGPAGDREEWERTGKDDSLRPLTAKGKKEVRKAAAGLVRLVPTLYEHLNPMTYEDALRLEGQLAESLRKRGFQVFGGH